MRAPLQPAIIFGFPILIVIVYTNISDVLLRQFNIPSVLQLAVVALAAIVWLARAELRPLGVVLQPMTLLLVVYCALLFASSIWAVDLSWADARIVEAFKGLVILVIGAALMPSWQRVRMALATLVTVAASFAAISCLQIAAHDTTHELGGLAQIQSGNLYGSVSEPRAAGPVGDPNFYAQILLIAIPLAAFLAVTSARLWSRIVFAVMAIVIAAGVLVTYSRGAMISVVAMALLLPFAIPLRGRVLTRAAIAAALLLAVVPSTVLRRFYTVAGAFSRQSDQPEDARDASVDKRKLLFSAGIRMFDDAPLFGVGAGNFGRHYWHYADEVGSSAAQYDDPGDRQFPHSLYVEVAAENGLAGLACFGGALIASLVSLFRSRKMLLARGEHDLALVTASIALAIAGYLVSSVFLHSAYQRYLWLLLAFVPAIARLSRQDAKVAA